MTPWNTATGRASSLRRVSTAASGRVPFVVLTTAAYVFVVISRISDEFPSLRLALVTAGLTGVLVLLDLKNGGWGILRRPDVRTGLALLGLSTATIPFSAWPGQSFSFVVDTFSKVIFLFLVIVHSARSVRAVQVLTWAILAAMAFLEIGLLSWGTGIRPQITNTYDSNDLAFVMVLGIPLAAMWGMRARGLLRYLSGLVFVLAVLTIVATRSRGGFVGLCVVVVLLIVRMPRRQRRRAVVLVVGCALILGAVGSDEYWERISTIWSGKDNIEDYDASGVWGARWEVWQTGLELMLRHALLGVGAGVFDVAEGQSHGGKGKWSAAHNSFLQLGAELGIPGLLLFLFLIYRGIKNCVDVSRMAKLDPRLETHAWLAGSLEISLYGYIVCGLALSQAYAHILYALIALSIALVRQATEVARSGDREAERPPASTQPRRLRPGPSGITSRAARIGPPPAGGDGR